MFCPCSAAQIASSPVRARHRAVHSQRESESELVPEDSDRSSLAEECDSDSLPDGEEAPHAPHQSSVPRPHFVQELPLQTSATVLMGSPAVPLHRQQSSSGSLTSVPMVSPTVRAPMPVASPTAHGPARQPGVASPVLAAAVPIPLPSLLTSSGRRADPVVKKTSHANGLQAPAKRTDFSGKWCMTHVDGDLGQLMVDASVSWALRRMAKSMNYGLGHTFQEIKQNGDHFIVAHSSPVKSTTMEFSADAGYQETVGVDGLPVLVNAQWDCLHLTMQSKKPDGRSFAPTRRYIQGDEMVIEAPLSTGATVKRFFKKQ